MKLPAIIILECDKKLQELSQGKYAAAISTNPRSLDEDLYDSVKKIVFEDEEGESENIDEIEDNVEMPAAE